MKISVITVCYNAEKYIYSTIKSVLDQTYRTNMEYIIIDGNSTDNTLSIINSFAEEINLVISEPDKGIYDAMNKGVRVAKGEWIIFMNAGDTFFQKDTVRKVFNEVNSNLNKVDIIYGNTCRIYKNFEKIVKADKLNNLWKRMVFSHQSAFVKKRLLLEHPFNISYKIAADFEFFLWAYFSKKKFYYVNEVISKIDMQGLSNKERFKSILERWDIVKNYKNDYYTNLYYNILLYNTKFKNFLKNFLPETFVDFIIKIKR